MKVVIDRFYANDDALQGDKKAALITAMAGHRNICGIRRRCDIPRDA